MSSTGPLGDGWRCVSCGQLVLHGCTHSCPTGIPWHNAGTHYIKRLTLTEVRVINAARKWRHAYMTWLSTDQVRDLRLNGENLALSELLDALAALDKERNRGI